RPAAGARRGTGQSCRDAPLDRWRRPLHCTDRARGRKDADDGPRRAWTRDDLDLPPAAGWEVREGGTGSRPVPSNRLFADDCFTAGGRSLTDHSGALDLFSLITAIVGKRFNGENP